MLYGLSGVLTKMQTKRVPYTFNRSGYYYFSRRVPSDLLNHYSYPRVVQGLRTKSVVTAKSRALVAAAKLDEYWSHLRMADPDLLGRHLLKRSSAVLDQTYSGKAVSVQEAMDIYFTAKGKNKPKSFKAAVERAFRYLIEACGAHCLHEYTREDALKYRDYLVAKGLVGSTITRILNTLRSVINFVIAEYALDIKNLFIGLYHDRAAGVSNRKAISVQTIKKIQTACQSMDDDLRWLIALLSDTGMRLSEGAGLLKSDIQLGSDISYIIVQPHSWRRLKTASSKRKVPLVGSSLWAAQRILSSKSESHFAFPRYNRGEVTNGNSASAALNKWLKPFVGEGRTLHSFRHSMRDRLREVECPVDMIDQIGGWSREGVGEGYGEGYSLKKLHSYMTRL